MTITSNSYLKFSNGVFFLDSQIFQEYPRMISRL